MTDPLAALLHEELHGDAVRWPCWAGCNDLAARLRERGVAMSTTGDNGQVAPNVAQNRHDALAATPDAPEGLRKAARAVVDSAVLVPMEREDDDDGPAELWCVHSEPLATLRAALGEPR